MIAINLSNQQALDADPRAIQQINFTANLDRAGNAKVYFILKEAKETLPDFFTRNSKSIVNKIIFNLNTYKITQYNSFNVKLLNKLKSSIKNETDVVSRISSNMVGNSNDNTNFPNELLLTNRQVANIRKAFAKNTSTDIKLSKT